MRQNRNQQVQLCNNLNMNFDEASELFGNETLGDMQIAKVCGGMGIVPLWMISTGAIKYVKTIVELGVALYAAYQSFDENSAKDQEMHFSVMKEATVVKTAGGFEVKFGGIDIQYHSGPSGSNEKPCGGASDTITANFCPCGIFEKPTN